jgi:predicted XRE-type DNA-binding protein
LERQSFDNVWDALEDTPAEAANMTMRADILILLQQKIKGWNLTQTEAAARLQVTQPRLNELLKSRVNNFSLDALINLADKAGLFVELKVSDAA